MSAVSGLLSSGPSSLVGGLQTTNDLVGEFQETIFVRNAKGLNVGTTLFGLMSKLKSEPADNIEYSWFERDPVRRLIYTNGGNLLVGDTTLTFDDSAAARVTHFLEYGTVLRNDRTGEYIRITATPANSGDTAVVSRGFGGSTAAAILDNDAWVVVTLAKDEGAAPVRAAYEDPSTLINYVQTFNSSVYLTNAFKGQVIRSDIEGPLTDRRIQALEKIGRDIEFAFLMGRKARVTGNNGYQYFTGGIYDSLLLNAAGNVQNGLADNGGTNIKLSTFNSWLSNFMTYGSDVKLAFCGPSAYSAVSTFANSATNGYRIMQNESVFGMHITTINTPYGELSLAFHPLLKEVSTFTGWMFAVDLPLLVQKTFEPLFLEPDIQTPGEDTYKEQYRAKLGLKLKFANAFGVIYNLTGGIVAG